MQEINLITNRLESARIPYCIVGGLAAIAYGRPRLTLDADLVPNLSELLRWISELGLEPEWELISQNQ